MKKCVICLASLRLGLLTSIFLFSAIGAPTVFAGPGTGSAAPVPSAAPAPSSSPAPYRVDIDESVLEDDPEFFENPPIWSLKHYSVYPRLQRHKFNKNIKILKFKALFEYTRPSLSEAKQLMSPEGESSDTLENNEGERPIIGKAMCKVPDPYYAHELPIIYKGPRPINSGKRVSVSVLIPFPSKFAAQLKKNPATCSISANNGDDFPVSYIFEVKRVGREFEMTFMGVNTDEAPPLEDTPQPLPDSPQTASPPPITAQDHIRGPADAKITLIEYSDPNCPFCQRFHPTMKQILAEFEGKVRWVYRHFPIIALHPDAHKKAEASECANELGGSAAFWDFLDELLETVPDVSELSDVAQELGLDEQAFSACLDSGKYKNLVDEQMEGGARAGVNGTPSTFLFGPNGFIGEIVGAQPYETVVQEVERALR